MSTVHENTRRAFGEHFLANPIEGAVQILFRGAVLMTIERDDRLPVGFHDRLVRHVMDLLTGRRSALWDEQAVFGDKPRDDESVRALAKAIAADNLAAIEAATSNKTEKGSLAHEPPPPAETA